MNYYEHHIGDYAEATSHLSILEDGIYSRLIRKYYATEKPLPLDLKILERLVGCRGKEEKSALQTILAEFFVQREDGYHQERCDGEIERYLESEPERLARRDNDKERKRRSREHRARLFNDLRELGVTPKWDAPIGDLEANLSRLRSQRTVTDQSLNGHSDPSKPVTDLSAPRTASQSPPPSPHLPIPTSQSPISSMSVQRLQQLWEQAKAAYPSWAGRQNWLYAEKYFKNRVGDGIDPEELLAGVQRYAKFVTEGGVTSSKYVLPADKFFGDVDSPWKQPWDLPVQLEPPPPIPKGRKAPSWLTPEEKAEFEAAVVAEGNPSAN